MTDHDARHYRKDWMSDDQWECARMFADVLGGFHHVMSPFKPFGGGVKVSDYGARWATFDFDALTRIVLMAHDRMIRVSLEPSGPRMVGFALWKRHTREGSMSQRHPTIDDAIAMHRKERQ